MKLTRYKNNPILARNPKNHWEAGSVFNPSIIYDNGIYRMVYRATNDIKTKEKNGYISSIGYAESVDGIHFKRFPEPLIYADQPYENGLGCEDPRVTKIKDTYYLFYTAVKGFGVNKEVRIALAISNDFKNWKKHGIVGPLHTRSKAACLFPEKINDKYIMFYTWMPDRPLSSILQVKFDNLEDVIKPPKDLMSNNINNYQENVVFQPPVGVFRGAEVGAVPIKTREGWLFIYCNANSSDHPEWTISAALLDLKDPRKILAVTEKPMLSAETKSEKSGIVKNVVFPEGALKIGDELFVYYGSGDQGICLATCNFNELLNYLISQK